MRLRLQDESTYTLSFVFMINRHYNNLQISRYDGNELPSRDVMAGPIAGNIVLCVDLFDK